MPHSKTKSDNDDSHARSAKAQKADEVQEAGSAKAGAGHPVVNEGCPRPPQPLKVGPRTARATRPQERPRRKRRSLRLRPTRKPMDAATAKQSSVLPTPSPSGRGLG